MRLLFLRCFLIALCYDNLVLILGDMGIGTRWYEFANLLRYGMRAAVIPFLTIFTLSVAQNCRVAFALNPVFARFCWTFTAIAWCYGMWQQGALLELESVQFMDHYRLVSASKTPPWAAIATNVLILPMALAIWRRARWPALFYGSLFVFLLFAAVGSQPWGYIASHGAEVIFICCLLLTERFVIRRYPQGAAV